ACSPPRISDCDWSPQPVEQSCAPALRFLTDVVVRQPSEYRLSERVVPGTLHDAPGRADRPTDPPSQFHTPPTSRRPLRAPLAASMRKSCPAADPRSDDGAEP